MIIAFFCFICLLAIVPVYFLIKESTYDWSQCAITEETRERHRAMWVQTQRVGNVTTTIVHPARDWTERKWNCPEGEKWRSE